MAISGVLILWLGRGTTFWGDELAWMLESPHLSLNGALQPHNGHLVLTTHLVYKVLFESFGVDTVLLTVALFFVYARRRVGPLVALAPSLVLLLFGSDSLHVLLGNGFTVLFAVACGLGSLLALERGDRRGDAGACALLCLGVITYSVALAFVAGAAVAILLSDGRRRRIWIVAAPIGIYIAWWLWALGSGASSEGQASLLNALLIPAWGFQSLGAILDALSGFGYRFSATGSAPPVGPSLAVLALAALGWRLGRRPIPRTLWAALAVVLAIWMLGALVANPLNGRLPEDPRYLFPGAIALLLVCAEAAAGLRWSRAGIFGLYAVALAGLAVNATQLRDRAAELRDVYTVQTRAAFTGLELAGHRSTADFYPSPLSGVELPWLGEQSPLAPPFSSLPAGQNVPAAYLVAAERYGSLGFSAGELRAHGEPAGAQADSVLAGALGLRLAPPGPAVSGASCRRIDPAGGSDAFARLPKGGALLKGGEVATEVRVRRFAGTTTFGVGALEPGRRAILRIPADRVAAPWWVYAPAELTFCVLR
jgi:hypothetical protein